MRYAGFWNTSNGSGGGKVVVGPAWQTNHKPGVFMLCLAGMWGLVHGLAAKSQRERERRLDFVLPGGLRNREGERGRT